MLGLLLAASCALEARAARLVQPFILESGVQDEGSFAIGAMAESHEPVPAFDLLAWFVPHHPTLGAPTNGALESKFPPSHDVSSAGALSSHLHGKRVLYEGGQIQGLVYHPRHHSRIMRHWYAPEHCEACKGFIDYETALRESSGSILLLWFLLLIPLLTWLLGTTAQDYFVPSLLYWTERLRMQPEIASATFIALGMSAPDIFSAVLAAEAEDLPLALSEVLGANMFSLCINGGMIIVAVAYLATPQQQDGLEEGAPASLAAKRAGEEQSPRLWAPLVMLLATTCVVALVFFQGHFTMAKALALPSLYAVYIAFLLVRGYACSSEEVGQHGESAPGEGPQGSGEEASTGTQPSPTAVGPPLPLEGLDMPKDTFSLAFLLWLYALPYYAVRWASIPPADGLWDRQRRLVSVCAPVGVLMLLVFAVPGSLNYCIYGDSLGRLGFTTALSLAVILSYCIYAGSSNGPKLPWFYPALTLTAALSSVIWLGAIAAELTALIEAVGFVLEVPRLRLGFTAVAWGNAAGDILTCYALVRRGRVRTAFNAVFSNPLVANWIGLGAMLLLTVHGAESRGAASKLWADGCPLEFRLPLAVCVCGLLGAAALHGSRLLCGGGEAPSSARTWAALLAAWYLAFLCLIFYVSEN